MLFLPDKFPYAGKKELSALQTHHHGKDYAYACMNISILRKKRARTQEPTETEVVALKGEIEHWTQIQALFH